MVAKRLPTSPLSNDAEDGINVERKSGTAVAKCALPSNQISRRVSHLPPIFRSPTPLVAAFFAAVYRPLPLPQYSTGWDDVHGSHINKKYCASVKILRQGTTLGTGCNPLPCSDTAALSIATPLSLFIPFKHR